jgi:hypothetical protein
LATYGVIEKTKIGTIEALTTIGHKAQGVLYIEEAG